MIVGIVGHEAAKFTPETEAEAREAIRQQFYIPSILSLWYEDDEKKPNVDKVVSGRCHLGGIDVWTIEEANKLGIETEEFPPTELNWAKGFKPRNIQIAKTADKVVCIVVKEYPPEYKGMRFSGCYHCAKAGLPADNHIKSGGCWTMHYAAKLGKATELIII